MTEFFKILHHLDKDVTLAINSLHCTATDWMWQVFSNKEIWFVLYLTVAALLIRNLGWKKSLAAVVAVVLTILCCDQLGNLCKWYFERLRPSWDGEMLERGLRVLVGKGDKPSYGFYSAHAANAIGFAVCTLRCFKWDKSRNYKAYGIGIIFWGVMVGISRIFVGMHYLGDVMTGFAVGVGIAMFISWLAEVVCRKYLEKEEKK